MDEQLIPLFVQRAEGLKLEGKKRLHALLHSGADPEHLKSFELDFVVHDEHGPLCTRNFKYQGSDFLRGAEQDFELLQKKSGRFVNCYDDEYPWGLHHIYTPPFGVFMIGARFNQVAPKLAIVGTRFPDTEGFLWTHDFAKSLVVTGSITVSGLARGIDGSAHRGSLDGAGVTYAVLPCGIDKIYPRGHGQLAHEILEQGGILLSEYFPGHDVTKYCFLERNRLIAGMSDAVLVVDAPKKSGALSTAQFALEEGQDIFVVKERLEIEYNEGVRNLAFDGAQVISSVDELCALWRRTNPHSPARKKIDDARAGPKNLEAALARALTGEFQLER